MGKVSRVKRLSPRDLLHIIFKHQKKIIFIFLTTLLAVSVWTYFLPPIYDAHCKVLISMEKEGVQSPPGINEQRFITSQVEILRSRFSIKKLIDYIGLDRLSSGMPFEEAVRSIQENLSLDVIGDSNIIDVGFRWNDPVVCAEVANTLADLYIKALNRGGVSPFPNQLEFSKKRLQEDEEALQRFRQEWSADSIDNHRMQAVNTLTQLRRSLEDTDAQIGEIEEKISRLQNANSTPREPYGSIGADLLIAQTDLAAFKVKKDSLVIQVKSLTDKVQTLDEKRAEFDRLIKKVEADREMLSRHRQREEAKATKDADERRMINSGIIEYAFTPSKPIKPRWDLNLVLAAIMGLVASVGVAFISEYLDHSFRDEEDVKRYLGLPVLASIPEKKKGISGGTGNI